MSRNEIFISTYLNLASKLKVDLSLPTLPTILISTNYILPSFFYTTGMETSIQAYGMVRKQKDKFTTRTELSIRDNGIVDRDMD